MSDVDYFLKIDGIKGESQDTKHAGEIEIQSFSGVPRKVAVLPRAAAAAPAK